VRDPKALDIPFKDVWGWEKGKLNGTHRTISSVENIPHFWSKNKVLAHLLAILTQFLRDITPLLYEDDHELEQSLWKNRNLDSVSVEGKDISLFNEYSAGSFNKTCLTGD
jgi:hypothetical protein